jgi:hypothetical protein
LKALVSENAVQTSERTFLIGAQFKSRSDWDVQDSLAELGQLAQTAGADVVGTGTQKIEKPTAKTFIGPGKAQEFATRCHEESSIPSSSTTNSRPARAAAWNRSSNSRSSTGPS